MALNEDNERRLQKLYAIIIDSVTEPLNLADNLYASAAIVSSEHQKILEEKYTSEKLRLILDFYRSRNETLELLINALRLCHYEALAEALRAGAEVSNFSELQLDNLKPNLANVPELPEFHVSRELKLTQIREKLREIKGKKNGRLVIHGLEGCGKTTLCAEVVRDENVIGPRGIFRQVAWISIPKTTTVSEIQILLKKLADRLKMSPSEVQGFLNADDAKEKINDFLANKYENGSLLIVLDNILESEVFSSYFNFKCPLLLTSRNSYVTDDISALILEAEDGLLEKKSILMSERLLANSSAFK